MAKKKNRKQYTTEQKYEYHKKRMKDTSVSENKRLYSKNWVYGFTDSHAKENVAPLENEFNRNKKYYDRGGRAAFQGMINGTKAAAKDEAAHWEAYREREKVVWGDN